MLAILAGIVAIAIALLVNLLSARVSYAFPSWFLGVMLALLVAADVMLFLRSQRPEDSVSVVDRAANDLFVASRKQWIAEAAQLGLDAATIRLPISWEVAETDLFSTIDRAIRVGNDIPEDDQTNERDWVGTTTQLAGSGRELAETWWRRVPSRRLVLLGEAGSGKTELLYWVMSTLLDRNTPDRHIPVFIPAASWTRTETGVKAWVVNWLATNYSFLATPDPGGAGQTLAERLFDERRLALVIDGLDEIPDGLASKAVQHLSKELRPGQYLLLSSRKTEYRAAVAGRSLDGALGVELNPQDPDLVIEYLSTQPDAQPSRWEKLRKPEYRALISEVFRTPLMVMLADAIYNRGGSDEGQTDPADLLRMGDRSAIEDRLLDGFVELKYADHSGGRSLEKVRRWFSFLADPPVESDSTNPADPSAVSGSINLAWWDLPGPPPTEPRPVVKYVVTPALAALWTAGSVAVMYSLILNDPTRGLTNALRISLAAVIVYAALLYLSDDFTSALVAILGAYIAGVMSGIYEHAVVAGLAAGLCRPSLRLVRTRLEHLLGVGVAIAVVPVLIRLADVLTPLNLEITLVQGFGGGFADGWVNRWDADWNGYVGILAISTAMVGGAVQVSAPDKSAPTHRLTLGRWTFPTGRTPIDAAIVGVLVFALGIVADGHQDSVARGWMLAPADGFAIGFLIWYLSAWPRRAHRSGGRWPWLGGFLAGAAAFAVNFLAYAGRTDITHPWAIALAESVNVALITWPVLNPPATYSEDSPRLQVGVDVVGPAVAAGAAVGLAAAYSLGAPGIAYGITTFVILLARTYRPSRSSGSVRAEEAGVAVLVMTGIVTGFGYALLYGVTAALAIKVSVEIAGRSRPSTGLRASPAGIVGGALLGSLVAFGASFSRIRPEWALVIGVTSAAAAVFAFGTVGKPAPETLVLSPPRLLSLDRRAFLRATFGLAVTIGLAAGTWTLARFGARPAIAAAIGAVMTYGITAGLVVSTAQTMYGHYTIRRVYLASDGRLPWRLMAFLNDAYEKRVLRRNGALYQFRHERLQQRFAALRNP